MNKKILKKKVQEPSCKCAVCGLDELEFVDLVIPQEFWKKINPTEEVSIQVLCPSCLLNRLRDLGASEFVLDVSKIKTLN